MIGNEIKELIDLGLIRKQFVERADKATLASVRRFAGHFMLVRPYEIVSRTIGALMIRHGILTPELVENTILSDNERSKYCGQNNDVSERWAKALGLLAPFTLEQLITTNALSTPVVIQWLKVCSHLLTEGRYGEKLASVLKPGASNAINWGITGIIEYEAVLRSFSFEGTRRDEFFTEQHPLLKAMRTTEFVPEKRRQVEVVVPTDDKRSILAQLNAVWQHYAEQSKLFQEIGAEPPVPADVRAENVTRVNKWQAREVQHIEIQAQNQRYIDVYARYNCAEMDPLMLALLVHTVGWYVDNRHAHLFTGVRLVPDHRSGTRMTRSLDGIPWAAVAGFSKISLLRVHGKSFKNSLLGANRMFLTHSLASEASDRHSIPIIGLSTWRNTYKYVVDQPYALFSADFDQRDGYRYGNRSWNGEDQSSSIAGTIDETLRALREAEILEIARANDVPLRPGHDHRWAPSSDRPS